MKHRAVFFFGVLLHGACALIAAKVAVSLAGPDALLTLVLILLLMFAAELGPLRLTDRVTGVAAWRGEKWERVGRRSAT